METDRQPAVAGRFYPAEPKALARQVEQFLAAAEISPPGQDKPQAPKAMVLPHAGYPYSGPVAASGYAALASGAGGISRVLLVGPAHRVAFTGLAVPDGRRWLTPLGAVELDQEALARLDDLPQVRRLDRAFAGEHCLEVHLPFLQTVLPAFRLVPVLVGQASAAAVAEVMERLWGGPETLILVSSDLSHYLGYEQARRLDARTSAAIVALDDTAIAADGACGHIPVSGLLLAARHHGLSASILDLRNSGDTAGPRDQVVGYGAYAFR